MLSGGRSSEHDVSLASGEAVRAGLAEGGHEVVDVRLEKDGGWTLHGEELSLSPGRGLAGADVVFPVLRSLRRGRLGAGPARAARRSLCGRGRAGLRCGDGQGRVQGPDGGARRSPGGVRGRTRGRSGGSGAALRQACAPRFVGGDLEGVVRGRPRLRADARVRARSGCPGRALLGRAGGRVLGARPRGSDRLSAGRDRDPEGRLVRL